MDGSEFSALPSDFAPFPPSDDDLEHIEDGQIAKNEESDSREFMENATKVAARAATKKATHQTYKSHHNQYFHNQYLVI